MNTVGIRQLKQQASELVRKVREEGQEIQITYRGRVVARMVPVANPWRADEEARAWANLDLLAAEIGAAWPAGISSVEAIAEARQ
jgi:prevent-host-death family protein